MRAVVDNDVLLKGACYGLLGVLAGCVAGDGPIGVLGASKFVVPNRIARSQLRGNPASAAARFTEFLATNEVVEPSADEQQLAASFESGAQQMALSLDAGESQLLAIFVSRGLPWLLTGDKRAIASVEVLLDSDSRLMATAGKVKCLEQLVASALTIRDCETIRRAICSEPSVDKALSICFNCGSSDGDAATAMEGLASYVGDLRRKASRVLAT